MEILSVLNMIYLALSSSMDQSGEDYILVPNKVVQDAKNVIDSAWDVVGNKAWYDCAEFSLFTLRMDLENLLKNSVNDKCKIDINDWYENWARARKMIEKQENEVTA